MNRLFLWLAGADRDTLRKCRESRRAETARLSALGTLVVVPAVLGLVSMSYAVSTAVPHPVAYLGAGVTWSAIVLVIDRYLVVSTRKAPRRKRRAPSLAVVARYIFAIFVGIAVAHPFSLLWFNDSISQQLRIDQGAAISARVDQADKDRDAVLRTVPPAQSPALLGQRQKLVDYKDCLTSLQQFEQSNAPKVQLPCGATTGIPTCAKRCQDISPRIAEAARDIEQVDAQITAARSKEAGDAARVGPILAQIDKRQSDDVQRLQDAFSFDYLARVDALREIEVQHPEVGVISRFILGFFVLVDVLPVTMKLSARAGEYDYVQESQLMRVAALETAMQEEIAKGWAERELATATIASDMEMSKAALISDLSEKLITFYTERKIVFAEAMSAFRARAHNVAELGSDNQELQLKTLQNIDDIAWEKTMKRIMDHLDKL